MSDQVTTNELILLRIELRAIRDRVLADLDAALARIERAIPEQEQAAEGKTMKTWPTSRWLEYLETGK